MIKTPIFPTDNKPALSDGSIWVKKDTAQAFV